MMSRTHDTPLTLAVVAGLGMFLSTLDSGVINIAMPTLIRYFHTQVATVIWTVTLYTLVLSTTLLLFGRIADRVGRLKIYVLGLIIFAFSSLLCGAAWSMGSLILFRSIQGLSAAMMQATAIALLTTRLQGDALTKAMGIFGVLIGLGPMLGPSVGGAIISSIGWRWIFWLNIPLCLWGLYGCYRLQPVGETLQKQSIHYVNLALMMLWLFALLISLNRFSHGAMLMAWLGLGIAGLGFVFYVVLDWRAKQPMIPLALFGQWRFSAPVLGIIAYGGATAVIFMLPPLYFEKLRDFSAWQAGLVSLSAPLGIMIAARLVAKIVPKWGTQKPMFLGIVAMLCALGLLTQMTPHWSVAWIFVLLLLYGLGGGFFQTPCYLHVTRQFPQERQAFISALVRMMQNLSIAFQSAGAALLISFQWQQKGGHLLQGIQHAWWMSVVIMLLAFLAFLQLRRVGH